MPSHKRFLISLGLLILLLLGGTAGYMQLEDWGFRESVYMTAITLSTVGFREVRPLSSQGEWFTIVLIFLSLTLVGFAVASVTAFLVQGELQNLLKGRRMQRQIDRLKDHYILCGCGAVGQEIARGFLHEGVPFVVVDKDLENAQLPSGEEVLFIEGDATDETILQQAGVERAKSLITALRNDPENVFVTLTARQLNPGLSIIARASEERVASKLRHAGADRVISPAAIAGHRMAYTALRPSVVNFLDVVISQTGADLYMEEVRLSASSPLVGASLVQANLGSRTGAIIVGVHDSEGISRVALAANASLSKLILEEGDTLIALGSQDQIEALKKHVLQ